MQFKSRNPNDPNYSENYEEINESSDELYRAPDGEGEQISRTRAARAESVVDSNSTVDGKFETEQDLRIEGTISGDVVCRGLLTIESGATAKANIEARDAHIRGRLEGEVTCSGKLELAPTAVVVGTVRAALFVVHEGASMNGTVETRSPGARNEPRPISSVRAEAPAPATEAAPAPEPRGNGRSRAVPSFQLSSVEPERASR